MKRKTIAILVLLGGMLGAFLITRLAAPSGGERAPIALSTGGANDPAFAFGNEPLPEMSALGALADANFTEQVVQRYGEEVLRLNPKGSSANGVALPPTGTLENLIANAVEQPLTFPSFTSRDLKTVPLGGKEGLAAYLNTLVAIQTERLGENVSSLLGVIARFVSEENAYGLEVARNDMRDYVGDLLTIPVPEPLVSFHVGLLNLWEKRVVLADTILKSGDDPLKVVVAVEHLSQTSEEETELVELLVANIVGLKL